MPRDLGVLRKLPAELAYLAAPAMKFGVHQSDDDVGEFLDNATKAEMSELAAIAKKVLQNDHYALVNEWLDTYDMTEHEEAANLYFLFGVMDWAELPFDTA